MSPSTMALVAFVAFGLGVTPGHASPCGDEIARLENTLSQAKNDPAIGPTAPQSVDAQLGYQPTPDSVKRAEADARGRFATILDRAKAFDAEGKAAECMQAVAAAKLELK
jgi:hypothetical protein